MSEGFLIYFSKVMVQKKLHSLTLAHASVSNEEDGWLKWSPLREWFRAGFWKSANAAHIIQYWLSSYSLFSKLEASFKDPQSDHSLAF